MPLTMLGLNRLIKDGRKICFYEITIRDNGKGFDTDSLDAMEGLHLGIRNVRERIEKMCKGTLDIQSEPGAGTKVVIRIPEEV